MCECVTCMCTCVPAQKKSSDRLEQIHGCDPLVSVGNWTWVLCKSSKSPRKDVSVSLTQFWELDDRLVLLSRGAASHICSVQYWWVFWGPGLVGFCWFSFNFHTVCFDKIHPPCPNSSQTHPTSLPSQLSAIFLLKCFKTNLQCPNILRCVIFSWNISA